jgi:hypothetical protein
MVSRLIKQKYVSLEEHGPSKGKLHFPTTRQAANCLFLALVTETNGG